MHRKPRSTVARAKWTKTSWGCACSASTASRVLPPTWSTPGCWISKTARWQPNSTASWAGSARIPAIWIPCSSAPWISACSTSKSWRCWTSARPLRLVTPSRPGCASPRCRASAFWSPAMTWWISSSFWSRPRTPASMSTPMARCCQRWLTPSSSSTRTWWATTAPPGRTSKKSSPTSRAPWWWPPTASSTRMWATMRIASSPAPLSAGRAWPIWKGRISPPSSRRRRRWMASSMKSSSTSSPSALPATPWCRRPRPSSTRSRQGKSATSSWSVAAMAIAPSAPTTPSLPRQCRKTACCSPWAAASTSSTNSISVTSAAFLACST